MAALIKGITVTLYERTKTGADAFGAPVYTEIPVQVENVLVTPTAAADVVNDLRLYGKRAEYELCLPKGDAHIWDGCRVDFFGQSWRVFAPPVKYIEAMVPLDWNRKVKVERYE
ncbi:hypothetical protein [Allofournierella sp.]|uniref:hypothetical protein n=1 Tax=Allofournierella sp. TaxID=1940256 RepID=UPI003AF1A590